MDISDAKHLGETLLTVRRKKNISLAKLGAKLGMSASTLSRVECGRGRLDFKNEVAVRRWLGLPLSVGAVTITGDTLANIKAAIHADKTLDGKAADALYDLMSAAYHTLARKSS